MANASDRKAITESANINAKLEAAAGMNMKPADLASLKALANASTTWTQDPKGYVAQGKAAAQFNEAFEGIMSHAQGRISDTQLLIKGSHRCSMITSCGKHFFCNREDLLPPLVGFDIPTCHSLRRNFFTH